MTKVLLLTDTHGDLRQVNDLVRKTGCSAVIHAGDFGFYDEKSVDRLSDREVRLQIAHSSLASPKKKALLSLPIEDSREYVRGFLPLSDLPRFLNGAESFDVPVYAAWGNHEDVEVVKRFLSGQYSVKNLHLLHEKSSFHIGSFHIFGLGGNFLPGAKLFQGPLSSRGGKVCSSLGQYEELVRTVGKNAQPGEKRVFVTHVSPGKEPFMSLLGAHLRSDLNVSGHMGAPHTTNWNEFGVRDVGESLKRLRKGRDNVLQALKNEKGLSQEEALSYGAFLKGLSSLPKERVRRGRGEIPAWYVNMWNINLPDAAVGCAVLEIDGSDFRLQPQAVKGLS